MDQMSEICVVHFHRRRVYRDDQWLGPSRRFGAGGPKYPLSDLRNDTALFRNRNEFGRRNIPPRRMLPAQQSLESDDSAVGDVFLWRLDKPHFISRNRIATVMLQ